jgi:hypothetical protein
MEVSPIINLYRTLEEAMFFKNSPRNNFYDFSGVQLLPNNPLKYIQATNTPNGINLEDWVVFGVSVCGNHEDNISSSFAIEKLTNSLNGNPQFLWSLKNVPFDFGWGLIYLRIQQSEGETFFSTPFKLTAINEEFTSQITYKYKRTDAYQSIGVNLWFRSESLQINLQNYYETSTENTVTTAVQTSKTEFWETESMAISNLIKIVNVMKLPYVYLNQVRTYFFEAPELPKPTSQENFGNMELHLTLNENDSYQEAIPNKGDFLDADFDENDFLIYN